MAKQKHKIVPNTGYILVQPFVQEGIFKSIRTTAGEVEKSTVIAIGGVLTDDHNIKRTAGCKVGDIILHSYIHDDLNIGSDKYKFVHFSNVRGVWEDAPKGVKS